MITRDKYMENSSELHHAYYLQFATEGTFNFVRQNIGLKKLKASGDPVCFNDLYKHRDGGRGGWIWDEAPINRTLCKELGEGLSPSTFTCVSKAAARQILIDDKE